MKNMDSPLPKIAIDIILEEYQVLWNFNKASRTLTPFSFCIVSKVYLFPKINNN